MKIKSKQVFFAFSISICWPTSSAELSCASFHSDSVQGLSVNAGAGKNGTVIGFSNGITAPKELTVATQLKVVLLFPWMNESLHGNFLYLERQNRIDGTTALSSPLEINRERDAYTITLNCYTSRGDDCNAFNNNWYGYLSGTNNGQITPPIINSVPSQSGDLSAAVHIATFNGTSTLPIHNGDDKLTIISKEKITDKITMPEKINLGKLNIGSNNSDTVIDYSINSNSIPIFFKNSTTPSSAQLMINGSSPVLSTRSYIPPFRFGMYLLSNSQPGAYTTTVNATWTCP
ncbi:TPA: hypothetical protein ACY4O8_000847 [Enterobacter cloacae]